MPPESKEAAISSMPSMAQATEAAKAKELSKPRAASFRRGGPPAIPEKAARGAREKESEEKAKKGAEELIAEEKKVKESAKDGKSKKAAEANKEKACKAASQQRKEKAEAKAAEE